MELELTPTPLHRTSDPEGGCGGSCGCRSAAYETPVLDVRDLPHAVRHAAVLGALDAVAAGSAIVLVAPHDPVPLLAEVEQRWPAAFAVGYEERGPDTWSVRLTRHG